MPPTFEPRRFNEGSRDVFPAENAMRRVNQLGPVILEGDGDRPYSLHDLVGMYLEKSEFFLTPDPDQRGDTRLVGAVPQVVSRYPGRSDQQELGTASLVSRIAWTKTGLDLLRYQRQAGFVSLGPVSLQYSYTPQDFIDDFGMTPEAGNSFLDEVPSQGMSSRTTYAERYIQSRSGSRSIRYLSASTPVSVIELEHEEKQHSRGKGEVVLAALGGLGVMSVLASACAPVQVEPTARPTSVPSRTPEPTGTPEPFSLLEATPTLESRPFTLPVNPPEYIPQASGGAFPEGIREVAELDYYRALETLYRQEVGSFLTANLADYQQFLTNYARQNNLDVRQVWNSQFGNDYQMVSAIIKRLFGGRESVYWYSTPGGALSARPDVPSDVNANFIPIELQQGTHADFRWNNEDRHIYLFEVDNLTGKAVSWLNTTTANAASSEGLAQAFEKYVTEIMPTTCLDPEVNQRVLDTFLSDFSFSSLDQALQDRRYFTGYAGFEHGPNWYRMYDLKVLGGYRFSLANQPGFGRNDYAHCILGATPHEVVPIPIIIGVEKDGSWSQTVSIWKSSNPSVAGTRIDIQGSEDADRWIEGMRGEMIIPLIVARYSKPGWERDSVWHVGYDEVLPLLRNPNGYIMKYTRIPTTIGPSASFPEGMPGNLSAMIQDFNLQPGGDVGFFTFQITVRE